MAIDFANHQYIAFLPNGDIVEGRTDDKGYTDLFKSYQPEEISLHLFKDEKIDIE